MKTALVMGISGSFGNHVAQALARQGWRIRALLRDPARLPARFQGAEVVQGDAAHIDDVRRATEGVDVVVYGVNPPGYNWTGIALPTLEATATVAEERGITIVFPGNVYVLNPTDGPDFSEDAPAHPASGKGEIRRDMEARLKQATERGARVILLRMGDFIGPDVRSSWLVHLLKRTRDGYTVLAPGARDRVHTWAYLPDAARVVAEMVAKRETLPAWSPFHFRGYCISVNDIADAVRHATGAAPTVKRFPWWAIYLLAPFSVMFRGLLEMRYLWNTEVNLDDRKLRAMLGHAPAATPLADALIESGLVQRQPVVASRRNSGTRSVPQ